MDYLGAKISKNCLRVKGDIQLILFSSLAQSNNISKIHFQKPKINIWYHLYVESKKKQNKKTPQKDTNELTSKAGRDTDIENKFMATKGQRGVGEG